MGQLDITKLNFDITHLGDLERIGHGFRNMAESRDHFRIRPDRIITMAQHLHPVRIGNLFFILQTEQDILRFCVFLLQIVAIVGSDEWDIQFPGKFYELLIDLILAIEFGMILDF